MVFVRALLNEMKKNTGSLAFILSAIAVAVLFLASGIYTDPASGRTYSIFECIFALDYEFIKSSYELSSIMVFQRGVNEYLLMFMPVLTTVSYISVFGSEFESTFYRYEMFRTQKKCIAVSKFCGGVINGGMVALVGTILYGLIVLFLFPSFGSYQIDTGITEMLFPDNVVIIIIKRLAGMFLYGMFSSILSVMFSALIRNAYVVLCLPFMITYLYSMTLNKIALSEEVLYTETFTKIQLLYPQSIIYLFDNSSAVITLLLNMVFVIVALCVYTVILVRKGDLQ